MGKIVKNLAPHWKTVILIFIMLVIQATCDLTLPAYTSDIIDTGIQNQGVEHILPEKVTQTEYNYATVFMTEEEKQLFTDSYTKDGDFYTLTVTDDKVLEELDQELIVPIMVNYTMSELSLEQFKEMMEKQGIDPATVSNSVQTFTKEGDESGTKYVDVRPIVAGMMTQELLPTIRENLYQQINTIVSESLKATGIAYAIK